MRHSAALKVGSYVVASCRGVPNASLVSGTYPYCAGAGAGDVIVYGHSRDLYWLALATPSDLWSRGLAFHRWRV